MQHQSVTMRISYKQHCWHRALITCDLFNGVSVHVEQHAAVDDAAPELKQAVEGESRHIGFAPPLAAILHVFLELQPPASQRQPMGRGLRLLHIKT